MGGVGCRCSWPSAFGHHRLATVEGEKRAFSARGENEAREMSPSFLFLTWFTIVTWEILRATGIKIFF